MANGVFGGMTLPTITSRETHYVSSWAASALRSVKPKPNLGPAFGPSALATSKGQLASSVSRSSYCKSNAIAKRIVPDVSQNRVKVNGALFVLFPLAVVSAQLYTRSKLYFPWNSLSCPALVCPNVRSVCGRALARSIHAQCGAMVTTGQRYTKAASLWSFHPV